MPLSSNPGQFQDVAAVLDAALRANGARYTLASPKAATYWRHRAYHYRSLLFRQAEKACEGTGMFPSTPYDTLRIQIEDCTAIIHVRLDLPGVLTDEAGNPLSLPEPEVDNDPLLLSALTLVRAHGEV
jgi:hypothetical protein